jgi:hypothetical protein
MAFKRFVIDGYGQLELNQVAFRRDGRVEAQCALDDVDFASVPAENGMLLAVDRVNRKIKFATSENVETMPVALNYTTEHMYDERANALKDFKLEIGTFYPRLGFLSVGELFTTNCFGYDDAFADDDAVREVDLSEDDVFGGISDEGAILLAKSAPEAGPVLKVVEKTTMPDGQFAFKFQVLKA